MLDTVRAGDLGAINARVRGRFRTPILAGRNIMLLSADNHSRKDGADPADPGKRSSSAIRNIDYRFAAQINSNERSNARSKQAAARLWS